MLRVDKLFFALCKQPAMLFVDKLLYTPRERAVLCFDYTTAI